MSPDLPSAGWYPNPDGSGDLRWWSGVGWTEYTRPGAPPAQPPLEQPRTQVLGDQTPAADATQVLGDQTPAADATQVLGEQTPAPNAWQQAAPPGHTQWPNAPAYGTYTPPPAANPLTGSGMRPLNGMFSDIGRITKRAWWPVLGISVVIWTVMSALLALAAVAFVDFGSARRGFDLLGQALQDSPDGNIPSDQADQIFSDLSDAFSRLPAAGWVVLGAVLTIVFLYATTMQMAAVNRVSMDAAAGLPVRWAAGWRSGFTAGARLFGYYILITAVIVVATLAVIVLVALAAQLSPGLAVALGILAFLGSIAVAFWLTGRLITAIPQAVVGRHALRWSWHATRGKFWAVLGRYLLWSLAASIIINVITTIVSIPVSLVFLGEASTSTDPFSSLGLALALNLLLLPFSMVTAAIVLIGIVPIWRDLTDHPEYRSIDDNGVPITTV
jgi:hypothetical protein